MHAVQDCLHAGKQHRLLVSVQWYASKITCDTVPQAKNADCQVDTGGLFQSPRNKLDVVKLSCSSEASSHFVNDCSLQP